MGAFPRRCGLITVIPTRTAARRITAEVRGGGQPLGQEVAMDGGLEKQVPRPLPVTRGCP